MKDEMIVIYLAGALRGKNKREKKRNMRRAKRWAERLWRMGFAVYSPHLNSGWLDTPETDPHVIPANIQLMLMCDITVVMPNWENSIGTKEEIKQCEKRRHPIFYIKTRHISDTILKKSIQNEVLKTYSDINRE